MIGCQLLHLDDDVLRLLQPWSTISWMVQNEADTITISILSTSGSIDPIPVIQEQGYTN